MKVTSIPPLVFIFAAASQVLASNDKPCWNGKCSHDIARSETSLDGSLQVWGSPTAISDITEAGGWLILGCDAGNPVQDIRLVCKSMDASESGCDHITQNGAVGTLVRLPYGCGHGPFALVTKWGEAEDQSIPGDVARKINGSKKRVSSIVKAATIDSDLSQDRPDIHGEVRFSITGGTTNKNATLFNIPSQRKRLAASHLRRISKHFDKKIDLTIPEQSFPLLRTALTCDPLPDISVEADAVVSADAQATLSVHVEGSLLPPAIDEVNLLVALNGDVGGNLRFKANIAGDLDTGEIKLFSRTLPGLDFGSIFKIGPILDIKARAQLENVVAQLDMEMGLKYTLDNVGFQLGNNDDAPSGGLTPKDSPLKLATSSNIDINGALTVHVIPVLSLGLDALFSQAEAKIFVNLDASTTVNAQITSAEQSGDATSLPSHATTVATGQGADATATTNPTGNDTGVINGTFLDRTHGLESRDFASSSGCFDVSGDVNANVGVEGKFFSLFDEGKSIQIFDKKFEVFKKCFGGATPQQRSFNLNQVGHRYGSRDLGGLSCPATASNAGPPETVQDGDIAASNIVPS